MSRMRNRKEATPLESEENVDMSWKYSTSTYPSRDNSATREPPQSKYGFLNSKFGSSTLDRRSGWSSSVSGDSKFNRNHTDSVEHVPVWGKASSVSDNLASVQRLKERYNPNEETPKDKKSENKDLPSHKSAKFYGRSYTSLQVDNRATDDNSSFSKFRRKLEKPAEPAEKNSFVSRFGSSFRSLDPPKSLYIPSETSKLPTRKYSSDLSPSTVHAFLGDKYTRSDKIESPDEKITVVTRGTSPTPTASAVYLRSKRTDYGIEKRVSRPRKRPDMVHKEVQTDREDFSFSKYAIYSDSNIRTKPWSSYVDKYSSVNSYSPKFSTRTSYSTEGKRDHFSTLGVSNLNECKRLTSREESDDPTTPDSLHKSPTGKPPLIKEAEKKFYVRKSPPSSFRLPLKLDNAKSELIKSPVSPNHPSSPLQCKITSPEVPKTVYKPGGVQSPKVTIDRCPDLMQAIADVSSASESSEEESSSEDEAENPSSGGITIKKSITNFLQNIPNSPNTPTQSQTRSNLYQKINFKRIESGEKAWWMESTDKVVDGVTKAPSNRSIPTQSPENQMPKSSVANNFLSPTHVPSRHVANNKDWSWSGSHKGGGDTSKLECHTSHEEKLDGKDEFNGVHCGIELAKVDRTSPYLSTHSPVNNFPVENDTHHSMKFNLQVNESFNDGRRCLGDFPRERSLKDINQTLQNGVRSPLDDKNHLEPGGMSGLITKAKAELAKTKQDIKKSSSREMSPMITDPKTEIDLYWKELADSVNRPLRLCDLDFTDLNSDDEADIFANFKMNGEVPPPPPMLIIPVPAVTPPKPVNVPAPPAVVNSQTPSRNFKAPAPPSTLIPQIVKNKKTVKLFWKDVKDEPLTVKSKTPNGGALIWDELTTVKVDTQKLEHLFESKAKDLLSKKQQDQIKNKEIIVLDPKRSNAINIGMTKLPPPRAIKTAILKMDSTVVNKEGIEKLLTMLPTEEEKVRIQEAQTGNPDIPLGSAEQFLLTLASITQLEARLRLWEFKLDFEISEKEICEPLMDLKQGMEILRVNKTFRGILSTLLSIGNFLNGYDVKGFQIDYLSKVPEVKDTVHKHSLLHHLCIIVMEKFPDSTDLYSEIGAVTRASKVDFEELSANIKKLEEDCKLSWNYLKIIAKHEGHTAMKVRMSDFLADCAERIIVLGVVHKRIMIRFQKFAYWLGIPMNKIMTTRPNEIFKIVSEFALEFRTTRDRVLQQIKKINREKSKTRGYYSTEGTDTVGVKMNSKEAKDDAKLKQLLEKNTPYSENMNTQTWRRQKKDTKNILQETNQNDEEIIETLIKTANQKSGLKERRRSRVFGKCCK